MRHDREPSQPKVMTPAEVEELVGRLRSFCEGWPIVLLYLHGAHARGTQSALSDLDIAVLLDPTKHQRGDFELDFRRALEETCRRDDVDLVILNDAGYPIRDRVVRSGRLVFARSERDRVLFEAAAIKDELDFQYYSEAYDRALFRELAEGRILGRS